jgi:hypothetical protein
MKTDATNYVLIRIRILVFISAALASCAGLDKKQLTHGINCQVQQSFCSTGRFAIRYQFITTEKIVQDAIHGEYEWASFYDIANNFSSPERAYLAIDSIIGTRLAEIYQNKEEVILYNQQNPIQKMQNWDELFATLFHLPLPGQAIVNELIPNHKKTHIKNNLPPGWHIERQKKHIKFEFKDEKEGFLRIDILPNEDD